MKTLRLGIVSCRGYESAHLGYCSKRAAPQALRSSVVVHVSRLERRYTGMQVTRDGLFNLFSEIKHTGKALAGPTSQWTADRVHAAATGPLWSKTAVFITWDDWGGCHDHVTPPLAST